MEINKIYNEDCLATIERMENNSIDMVITSPPYNKSRKATGTHKEVDYNKHYIGFSDSMPIDEYIAWLLKIMSSISLKLKDKGVIAWNMSYGSETIEQANQMALFVAEVIKQTDLCLADTIVWHKKAAAPNNVSPNKLTRICEFVYIFVHKDHFDDFVSNKEVTSVRKSGQQNHENIFNYIYAPNNNETCDIHKAAFSTELVGTLMSIYFKEGGVIYDPFMGTGTTAIAAIRYKGNYIGSEIVKQYVDWAEKRISQEKAQLTLF